MSVELPEPMIYDTVSIPEQWSTTCTSDLVFWVRCHVSSVEWFEDTVITCQIYGGGVDQGAPSRGTLDPKGFNVAPPVHPST